MAYTKPQTLVFQEFSLAPSEVTDPLRAHISGPNAMLHRFSEPDEKVDIDVGAYDRGADQAYPWPDRQAGSLVDQDSVKLFVEDALLMYYEDLIDDSSGGRGVITAVAGRKNRITNSVVNYKTNGSSWPRSSLLKDRDVQVGDVVSIRCVTDPEGDCIEHELWTYVEGFAAELVDPTIFPATADDNNAPSKAAAADISQTDGATNCIEAAVDGDDYSGLESGFLEETYTIEVVKSSVSGCDAARLRVTSASGTDNQDDVTPADFASATAIGTRGLTVTFSLDSGACEVTAANAGVPANEFVVGQVWEASVTQAFERVCALSGPTYNGTADDTYIVEVTKGGLWADLPEVTVTTVNGLDSSGPTKVTGDDVFFPVGSQGLTMKFMDCGDLASSFSSLSESVSATDTTAGAGDGELAGLRKGDKFHITVVSGANGPIRTLILRDDLNANLRDADDLDVRLFIPKTIEVTENRLSDPPLVNYEIESTQLVVKAGITAYDASWTDGGTEQPLPVWSASPGDEEFGTLYIEYREWLTDLTDEIGFIDSVGGIDAIPGQLDPLNPLKQGVYDALLNSNGTRVGYTAVSDPESLAAWVAVLDRLRGRDDLYNLVPLTNDVAVHQAYAGHVDAESTPEAGNWKGAFVPLLAKTEEMVVGKSSADAQALDPTSTDGNTVLATLEDNPDATGTQYTLLSVPANNSGFITYGVRAGDIVRFLFTVDAHGETTYSEFVVDSVLSENSLLLLNGHTAPISVAQKVEIWHTLEKGEIVTDLIDQAQAFSNRRVVAVWPDVVGLGGKSRSGAFLAASLAGLVSGVVPHQGLTNVEIAGYDDLASRTRDYFTSTQLDALAEGGVWIATEDRDGTPHTRHALTTDTLDLNRQEEMIRRNVDSISYVFLARLRPFIGRANATPAMVRKLRYEVGRTIKFLKNNGYTNELGPQLIDGSIALDSQGQEILRIHPLAADRIEIVLDLVVPAPLNHIELHLVI